MNILIVRLGALGDIVHAIPAAAAIRAAMPGARIDWIVDGRHSPVLELVTAIDQITRIHGRGVAAWSDAVRRLRATPYDVALDLQGLMKSAVLARASGASRVAGFSIWHLREKGARPFYSETDADVRRVPPPPSRKVSATDDGTRAIGNSMRSVSMPRTRRRFRFLRMTCTVGAPAWSGRGWTRRTSASVSE